MPPVVDPTRPLGQQLAEAQAAANILGRLTVLRDAAHKTQAPLRLATGSMLQSFSALDAESDDEALALSTLLHLPRSRALLYLRSLNAGGLTKLAQMVSSAGDQRVRQVITERLTQAAQQDGASKELQAAAEQMQSGVGPVGGGVTQSKSASVNRSSAQAGEVEIEIYTSFDLPPTRAVDYLRTLTPVTKTIFDGLSKQYQADAFTMAGVSDQRLIQRIRDELADVVNQGGTSKDFQAVLDRLRSTEGAESIGKVDIDGVFQGVTQKAYSAGRYEQMTEQSVMDALPYWQYWTAHDDRVRPEHRVLHLFCAQAIDPVWHKIYPPCGYGCRCSCLLLSASAAPEGSDQGGLLRLPALAIEKVPQPGYQGIFGVAA